MSDRQQKIGLFGIEVSCLTMPETISSILAMISQYRQNLKPNYVATLNVDFLVKAHSWMSSKSRNPELLHVLKQADLVTIDGMPLVWLSCLLGSSVKHRITGVDLLPQLSEVLSKEQKAVFLLGGNEKTLKLCMLYLQALYPGLRIVGAIHPKIVTEGELLESSDERDRLIIEQINQAAPDVLFLNLGNPKQELWYDRIHQHLKVPVSIGVGGTFDLLAGMIPRAPVWMQKWGMEWIYRLIQEPKRLGKRYLIDIIKFPWMAIPLILYHYYSWLSYKLFSLEKKGNGKKFLLFISSNQTLTVVQIPSRLSKGAAEELKSRFNDLFSHGAVVFDFKDTRHIDLEGVAFLLEAGKRAVQEKRPLFILGLSKKMRCLLKFHRSWDFLALSVCESPQDVFARLNLSQDTFFDAVQQEHQHVVISFFGYLDNNQNYELYLKRITPILYQKECIIDLTYCTYIDSVGIGFLLKLKKFQMQHLLSLKLRNLSGSLSKQLQLANVLSLFELLS